jgi:oxidoreductase
MRELARPPEDSGEPRIKTAIVGLGWAARSLWLPRLRNQARFSVTALVDPDPAARAAVSGGWRGGTPMLLSTTDDLPADQVDLAIVAVPNHRHAAAAHALLLSGIPVFVEKPVCLTVAEADRLAAAERITGSVLLAGSAACHRLDVQSFLHQARLVGQIRHVELAWIRARGVPGRGGWFTQRELAGGGALTDLGWHLLDILALLVGHPDFTHSAGTMSGDYLNDLSAEAAWRQDGADRPDARPADVEDTARAFLVTRDGISVAVHASWASHEAVDTTLIRAEGTGGAVTLRCTFGFSPNRVLTSSLTRTHQGETVTIGLPYDPVGGEYERQLAEFPRLLTDPGYRGIAIARARWIAGVIDQIYNSAYDNRMAIAAMRVVS